MFSSIFTFGYFLAASLLPILMVKKRGGKKINFAKIDFSILKLMFPVSLFLSGEAIRLFNDLSISKITFGLNIIGNSILIIIHIAIIYYMSITMEEKTEYTLRGKFNKISAGLMVFPTKFMLLILSPIIWFLVQPIQQFIDLSITVSIAAGLLLSFIALNLLNGQRIETNMVGVVK